MKIQNKSRRAIIFTLVIASILVFSSINIVSAAKHQTNNFIVEASDPDFAAQVATTSESLRESITVALFDQKFPDWANRCTMRATISSSGAGGATSFAFEQGQVFGWSMTVQGSQQKILSTVLPHEIAHTIVASYFRKPLPRWCDEGLASYFEPPVEKQKHRIMFLNFLRSNRGISIQRLFSFTTYPSDVMPFYAESYVLVEFLIEKKGLKEFVSFMVDGMNNGQWESAIKSHYGYQSYMDLQNNFLKWVKEKESSWKDGFSEVTPKEPSNAVVPAVETCPAGAEECPMVPVPPKPATPICDPDGPIICSDGKEWHYHYYYSQETKKCTSIIVIDRFCSNEPLVSEWGDPFCMKNTNPPEIWRTRFKNTRTCDSSTNRCGKISDSQLLKTCNNKNPICSNGDCTRKCSSDSDCDPKAYGKGKFCSKNNLYQEFFEGKCDQNTKLCVNLFNGGLIKVCGTNQKGTWNDPSCSRDEMIIRSRYNIERGCEQNPKNPYDADCYSRQVIEKEVIENCPLTNKKYCKYINNNPVCVECVSNNHCSKGYRCSNDFTCKKTLCSGPEDCDPVPCNKCTNPGTSFAKCEADITKDGLTCTSDTTKTCDNGKCKKKCTIGFIKFGAEWCAPCKAWDYSYRTGVFNNFFTTNGFTSIKIVDIDKDRQLASSYGIKKLPSIAIVDGKGKIICGVYIPTFDYNAISSCISDYKAKYC